MGGPEFAASDGKGHIFINIEEKNETHEIDSVNLKVTRTFKLDPGEGPSGLSIDARHGYLFPVCGNRQMPIVDIQSGNVVSRPAIGRGPDASWFDAKYQDAFSPNGRDGTFTVVHERGPGQFEVADTVKTALSARTMALDPKTHKIFLAMAEFGPENPNAQGRQRRPMIPGSFSILVVAP